MSLSFETHSKTLRTTEILDVLPSDQPHQRLMVLRESNEGCEQLVLQQESFAHDVGWFTQSRVCITEDQLCGLKVLLTGRGSALATPKPFSRSNYQSACEKVSSDECILSFPQAG
jgi:hypothetical protein